MALTHSHAVAMITKGIIVTVAAEGHVRVLAVRLSVLDLSKALLLGCIRFFVLVSSESIEILGEVSRVFRAAISASGIGSGVMPA